MRNRLIAAVFVIAATAAGVALAQDKEAAPAAAPAPSPCTDLVEAECANVAGCVWLPGYKVATGATVMGYCRPAPKPLTARRKPGAPAEPQQ
ncbi:MAG: hypothetical protein ABL901_03675 [Hyphomicrobiaceae bacterium]